jgi:hypothetical protein
MMRGIFKDKHMRMLYLLCRDFGTDKASEFYRDGHPRRGSSRRAAYWNGRSGLRSSWSRDMLTYACWAAGRDDLRDHGPVQYSEFGARQKAMRKTYQ